jgi:hypothetical protein
MKHFFSEIIDSNLFQNFELSFKISSITGLFMAVLIPELLMWYDNNIDYIRIALGVIAVDHLLGSYVHSRFKYDDWDWKKNITGFGVKLSMVVAFGFIMEGLAHITVEDDFIYRYVKMSGRILVILYPGISAMKNMRVITNGVFPPEIFFGRAKDAFNTGDIKKLKKDNDYETN